MDDKDSKSISEANCDIVSRDIVSDVKRMQHAYYKTGEKLEIRQQVNELARPLVDLDAEFVTRITQKISSTQDSGYHSVPTNNNANTSVLDIGCGTGRLLLRMRKEWSWKGKLTGIDVSEGVMDKAKQNASKYDIVFIQADAQKLPFRSESFDAITSRHMLYHVANPQRALDEVYRCLKKGGHFCISLNSSRNKPMFNKIREILFTKFGFNMQRSADHVNSENIIPLLTKFKILEQKIYRTILEFKEPDSYVAYIATYQDFFETPPDNAQWNEMMQYVRKYIEQEIRKNGIFCEENYFSVTLAKKAKKE